MGLMTIIANVMAVTAPACTCEKPAPDALIAIDDFGNRVACSRCLGMITREQVGVTMNPDLPPEYIEALRKERVE